LICLRYDAPPLRDALRLLMLMVAAADIRAQRDDYCAIRCHAVYCARDGIIEMALYAR